MDTNVLVAALRSQNGASYKLLSLIDGGKIHPMPFRSARP